ncbi:hypothetical protein [Streptomyces olivaceus]
MCGQPVQLCAAQRGGVPGRGRVAQAAPGVGGGRPRRGRRPTRRVAAAAEAAAVRREADRLGAAPLRERLDDLARRGRLTDPARGGPGGARC